MSPKHFKLVQAIEDLIESVEKAHNSFLNHYDGDLAIDLRQAAQQADRLKKMKNNLIAKGDLL
jgi:hypothetical protein